MRISDWSSDVCSSDLADHSVVTLHSLSRHLVHTLPVVKDVLSASIFPEKELEIYQRNSRQRLQVNLEKNDFRARRAFNSAVFGSDSAHGYAAEPADFDHKIGRAPV